MLALMGGVMQSGMMAKRAIFGSRLFWLGALFCAELIVLAIAYQFFADIQCYLLDDQSFCTFLRSLVARAMVILAVSALLMWAWPAAFSRFAATVETRGRAGAALWVHGVGVTLLFVPLIMAWGENLGGMFRVAVWPWSIGGVMAAGGGLLWLAPKQAWAALLAQDRFAMVPILLVAAVLPDVAGLMQPLWDWSVLTQVTFGAVAWLLGLVNDSVYVDPAIYNIGINSALGGFVVHVGQPCSGVEGFALVSAFVAIYGYLFRSDLNLPRYAMLVLPLGLLLSWVLNVVRIAGLILIGAHVSPDLAVNGFHSYAGWLFFIVLAMGLICCVQVTPWLHLRAARIKAAMPLRLDPVAAMILPFLVLMVISTAVSALFLQPELGYPLKVLGMAVALGLFWPVLRAMPWSVDRVALLAGTGVGLLWIALADRASPDLAIALAGLSLPVLVGWIILRVIGTVVLVPVIEEMFFRGYLLSRLDGPGIGRRIVAIALSSAAFGLLHGRWIEAGAAGVVFALVFLRRNLITDAILAHVAANLVVAVFAVWRGDFSLI